MMTPAGDRQAMHIDYPFRKYETKCGVFLLIGFNKPNKSRPKELILQNF